MCSIGITNKEKSLLETNKFAQKRGPDKTSIETINGIQFLHNLLHLTGEITTQPFQKNNIVALFNGEIYNYLDFGDYKTDGEVLIDLYEKHGTSFVKKLDGEFAICVIDFERKKILIANDPFACKPLWYQFTKEDFGIASYKSQLVPLGFENPKKLYANKTRVYSLETLEVIEELDNHIWDLNQYKDSFDDWISAFEQSISKRTKSNYGIYLGLSSGYDSGAIACELLAQNINFKSFTIAGPENRQVVNDRVSLIPNHEILELTRKEYEETKNYIVSECEEFLYEDQYKDYNIKGDKASFGLASICKRANRDNLRIYLSGQGADEIISDYGFNGEKIYDHSSFGGKFPNTLDGFFPWHSFYDGTQIQYLNKEEYVAGHYGIETRYPFLDKGLVQEFLWLKPELKNSIYKSSLDSYLRKKNFPFAEEKRGFDTLEGLKRNHWYSWILCK
tara:strand:+ start:292 stop:1635 length:1344 start_codon:yes stop_codon:yes gene_type:complete